MSLVVASDALSGKADSPFQRAVLSVRRIIRKGIDSVFTEDGGWIENRTSRRKIDSVERKGAYFIKMKILSGVNPPDDAVGKSRMMSPSARPVQ